MCVLCKHTPFYDHFYPQNFLHISPDNNLTWTVYYEHYMKYILKSCKTKQTWGLLNFWCCQETSETLFFNRPSGSPTLNSNAAVMLTRLCLCILSLVSCSLISCWKWQYRWNTMYIHHSFNSIGPSLDHMAYPLYFHHLEVIHLDTLFFWQ